LEPHPYEIVPAYGLTPVVMTERAAWLRDALASGVGVALWNVSELDERHVRCQLPADVPEPGDVVGVVRARRLDGDAEPDLLQAAIIERIREANLGRSEAA
ncbi:MAG: hypothetical protein P8P85_08840, partial [Acidimicrobiales bacterium]|nr:hypothetical protein [Acidimicrobiales bacterium]